MKNNFNINQKSLVFASKKKPNPSFAYYQSETKLFLKRLASKKINLVFLILLFSLFLFLIFSAIFYPYLPNKAVKESSLFNNLPNYWDAEVFHKFDLNDPFLEQINLYAKTNSKIIINSFQAADKIYLTYNPYQLLQSIYQKDYVLLFGTNANGIDRFSLYIHSFGQTILLTLVALIFQIFLGTIIGISFGYYSNKNSLKMTFFVFSALNTIPFLIFSYLLFKISNYSFLNAIIILSFLGSFNFFYAAYSNTLDLKNKVYIDAYIVSGLSDLRIIFRIILPSLLLKNLIIVADNLVLNILAIAACSFFNIKGIENSLNIGNVFKNAIEDLSNISYIVFIVFATSFYIILLKFIGFSFYKVSNPLISR